MYVFSCIHCSLVITYLTSILHLLKNADAKRGAEANMIRS